MNIVKFCRQHHLKMPFVGFVYEIFFRAHDNMKYFIHIHIHIGDAFLKIN